MWLFGCSEKSCGCGVLSKRRVVSRKEQLHVAREAWGEEGGGPGHYQAPCSLRIVLDRPEEEAASLRWWIDSACLHAHFDARLHPCTCCHMWPAMLMLKECLFADGITFHLPQLKHRVCRHAPLEEILSSSFCLRWHAACACSCLVACTMFPV